MNDNSNTRFSSQNKPPSPILIYDGDCGFCLRCVEILRGISKNSITCLPFQEALSDPFKYPQISRQNCEQAVQYIDSDGTISSAALAVYRVLALGRNPNFKLLVKLYLRSKFFADLSEWGYRFVARHRSFFSKFI